jgi:hypothetical protein
MKWLKLFDNYKESSSVDDKLQIAEDFLDDVYTELFDEWRLTHGSLSNVLNNREEKVYYFILEAGRADCHLLIVFDKSRYKHHLEDMTLDFNRIFTKKVKPKYKFAKIESSTFPHDDSLWRILISVNVENRNTGSY